MGSDSLPPTQGAGWNTNAHEEVFFLLGRSFRVLRGIRHKNRNSLGEQPLRQQREFDLPPHAFFGRF